MRVGSTTCLVDLGVWYERGGAKLELVSFSWEGYIARRFPMRFCFAMGGKERVYPDFFYCTVPYSPLET